SSSPLLLPSIDRRANKPEVCLPPRKQLCIALGPRYEVDESSSAPTARPTRGFRADDSFVATFPRRWKCSLASSRPLSTLRLMSTLQTQVTTLQGQQGPASGLAQPEIPEEAGSSS
ncbi:hypothetical protein Tco_1077177, partial [Tanacetum coccineum]